MGRPSPGIRLGLVDDEGKELGIDQEGNIAVLINSGKSGEKDVPWLFDGYIQADGSAKRPEVKSSNGSRWYLSGDRATIDKDGYFWFVGRNDDVISSAGYRIGPLYASGVIFPE